MRAESLGRRADFSRAYSAGRRARRDGVTVFVATRPEPSGPRLGLAIPTSVGNAVTRNRLRRRLKAAFGTCPVGADRDVVVRAESSARDTTFQELVEALEGALREAGAV
jgi:ribonuclease P protein component